MVHKSPIIESTWTDNITDLCVLLHSRLYNFTQTYTIANTSCSDPTLLDLVVDGPGHTLHVTMEPCLFQGDTSSNTPSHGRAYFRQGLTFNKLFMLRSDLSVHESIVYATSTGGITKAEDAHIEDLFWTVIYRPKSNVRTIRDIQEMDDFLEPEGIEAITEPTSKLPLQVPTLTDKKRRDSARRTVDNRTLYRALIRNDHSDEETARTVNVPSLVTRLQEMFMDLTDIAQLPLGTLLVH
jgi:hypothetical protein